MTELQRVRSGTVDVVLLSPRDALRHGKDTFFVEFRAIPDGTLIDAGNVRATANMPMPGMAMFGNIEVQRTSVLGRYAANSEFEMAGTWRMAIEWDGPSGKGSVAFSGTVQ
jgi:YtkA-like protein